MSDSKTTPGTAPPVSWLSLERHALGELSEAEAEAVARDLDARGDSRACFDRIQSDHRDLPGLAALPAPAAKPGLWARLCQGARLAWVPVALAAALLLVLMRTQPPPGRPSSAAVPGPRIHVKGGDVAISLVRERGGDLAHEPTDFTTTDRFKVLITCPPHDRLRGEVMVIQDHDAAFPLPAADIACGNRVTLPGAFRITGSDPAAVCFVFAQRPANTITDTTTDTTPHTTIDRATLAARKLDLPRPAVCATLTPLSP